VTHITPSHAARHIPSAPRSVPLLRLVDLRPRYGRFHSRYMHSSEAA